MTTAPFRILGTSPSGTLITLSVNSSLSQTRTRDKKSLMQTYDSRESIKNRKTVGISELPKSTLSRQNLAKSRTQKILDRLNPLKKEVSV